MEIKAGNILRGHHHFPEQITYIMKRELDMIIDGVPSLLKAGMFHIIPFFSPHSATAPVDCKAIDVFSPVREDYK